MYVTICGALIRMRAPQRAVASEFRKNILQSGDVQIAGIISKHNPKLFRIVLLFFQLCAVLFYLYTIFLFQSELFKSIFPHDNIFLEDFYGFICLFCYLQYVKQVFCYVVMLSSVIYWTLSCILMGFYFINVLLHFIFTVILQKAKAKFLFSDFSYSQLM